MADYGSVPDVASLTKKYTNSGSFDGTTNPTTTQIGTMLTWLSATINVLLAGKGFVVPVVSTVVKPMLDGIVVGYAKDLVEAANSAGRFFTDKNLRGGNPFTIINKELAMWIDSQAKGIDEAGADRTFTLTSGVMVKDLDDSGNTVEPIFQVEDYGNQRRP